MPLRILQGDITKVAVDAIVNVTDSSVYAGGGDDRPIHVAAGPELAAAFRRLGGCKVGQAAITEGYGLPAKYVIHMVVPVWGGGDRGEMDRWADCFKSALAVAKDYQLESIAFPWLASDLSDYPQDGAYRRAMAVIGDFLRGHEMTVILVAKDKAAFRLPGRRFLALTEYIRDKYASEQVGYDWFEQRAYSRPVREFVLPEEHTTTGAPIERRKRSLEDVVNSMEETFSQMLLRLIDEKNLTDPEAYKRANVDRKLFSKIRNDIHHRPKKTTAVAFAIALELSLDETKDLLRAAGYALSRSSKFDLIIEYFIREGTYDVFEINQALFAFDQDLLAV